MNRLRAQIRKNRELKVTVGKFVFLCRRPTDVEALEIHQQGGGFALIAHRFVDGWENVVEDDIVGGATMTPIEFDRDVWQEWCADRPDFWAPIAEGVLGAYTAHSEKRESSPKA